MQNLVNKKVDVWVRPWNKTKFDDLANRDERFLSIVIKGALGWLSRNIVLYNKPLKHFIFNTGSTLMYMEDIGYEYSESETFGEDQMYMSVPSCICEIGSLQIQTDDLSSQFVRGTYERLSSLDNQIHGYNAEIRRIPLELELKCKYILGTFNESLILVQELLDKLVFQKYYRIVYLGNIITCSIEFPTSTSIQFEKIDMASPQHRNKTIDLDLKVCASYPQIDIRSESDNANIISGFGVNMDLHKNINRNIIDEEKYGFK